MTNIIGFHEARTCPHSSEVNHLPRLLLDTFLLPSLSFFFFCFFFTTQFPSSNSKTSFLSLDPRQNHSFNQKRKSTSAFDRRNNASSECVVLNQGLFRGCIITNQPLAEFRGGGCGRGEQRIGGSSSPLHQAAGSSHCFARLLSGLFVRPLFVHSFITMYGYMPMTYASSCS
ncbi:hypothetical protein V8C44DRAFT_62525 [Trichoderma aethiopicum]